MKILLLTSFPADAAQPSGGVEAVSVNLAAALARRPGTEVQVLTTDADATARSETRWQGVTIHRVPRAGRLLPYATGAGRRLVAEEVRRLAPAVVHAHDFYGLMTRGLDVPRVFTVHGFIHEDTRYAGGRLAWARARVWKHFETAAWADQPHIVSISPYVRERLHGIARGQVHDIENPISPEAFTVRGGGGGGIFCAAAITPRKNTLGLVRAFALMAGTRPAARLVLAGPSPDAAYRAQVEAEIAAAGLRGRVELPGRLSAVDVRVALARADVFALLSFEEGAPMGIAEAMAAGVPVVASNRCGMPYMVRPGVTGWLVDPHEPAQAAARFSELLGDASARAAMGAAARADALERFHPERVAARTAAVYEQSFSRSFPV